jgi:hypothetical protein
LRNAIAFSFFSFFMTWLEGNARSVFDADVDELPADAEVMVDGACLWSGDPMAHGADPSKSLDIDVNERA